MKHARCWLVLVLLLCMSGCATFSKPATVERQPLTPEQARWWAENKHRRTHVPGRGWYVEGTSGFFDDEGRPIKYDKLGVQQEEDQGFLEKYSPKNVAADFKKMIGRGPDEQKAKLAMAEGDALFRQKDYLAAAKQYREAYKRWPDSPLEEEALFKCGESEFFADRYVKASDEYGTLVKKYSSTQYLSLVAIRRFAIGRYWEEYDTAHPHWPITPNLADRSRPLFDTLGHALKEYEQIRLTDPTGNMSDESVMATANCYFVHHRWDDADYHYALLRTEYPRSEYQYQAHLLGLRCKLLKYQGPGYDASPLVEAEELAVQLLTQFPTELGEERERIVQVRGEVRAQMALREWERAEYYAKGQHHGSARVYYEKLVKEFPDTKLAQQARVKLDETSGLPDHPTYWYEPLVNALPKSTRESPKLPQQIMTAREPSPTVQR